MSETHSFTPPSPSPSSSSSAQGLIKDVALWRRKSLSFLTLLVSTVAWVLLEAYGFNFVTVASWACMLAISALFLWHNLLSLLGKEPGSLSSWEMTEESAEAAADSVRELMEEGIRWMFRASAETEWYAFAGIVALLFIVAKVASCFELPSLLYIGTVAGMTGPVTYRKYEERMKRYAEGLKARWRGMWEMLDERVVRKLKSRFDVDVKKEKKID